MGETLRPVTTGFNRSLSIETRAERLTGDPGAVLLREVLDATGNKLADLFIQIKIGLSQDLSIRVSFQIEVYRRALLGYFKRKCCLANLPGSQEDSSRLSVECRSHGLCCLALIHTLQLFRRMEDLQGYFA